MLEILNLMNIFYLLYVSVLWDFTNRKVLHFQQLMDNLDRDLQYAIKVEGKMDLESVCNYEEVKNSIEQKVLETSKIA